LTVLPLYRTNFGLSALLPEGVDSKTAFPAVNAWNDKLNALPYVAEALKEREELMKKQ
jgi:glutathione S-transferase